METVNFISITESAQRELSATGANLVVRISGQAFFTGREAFKKAAEVSECVSGLISCGIPEDKIRLKNVATQVESGFLAKSSSASYELEVVCDSLDLLGPAVATIASLKNSELVSMSWNYTDIEKTKREILQDAVRLAKESATAIAIALGISLAGVHRLRYEISGLDDKLATSHRALSKRKRSRIADWDFDEIAGGLNLSHTANVTVNVIADFLVETG